MKKTSPPRNQRRRSSTERKIHPRYVFPVDIARIMYDYTDKSELVDWIKPYEHLLSSNGLSENPEAVYYLSKPENHHKINWDSISDNTNSDAIPFLMNNLQKVNWTILPRNEALFPIVEQHWSNMRKSGKIIGIMSSNPRAINILEQNRDKINWSNLSSNPAAIHILQRNMNKIDWNNLSSNPSAMHILQKNMDKVHWTRLTQNPSAMYILKDEKYQDNVDWDFLPLNPNKEVVDLIHKNIHKFNNTFYLSGHPDFFHMLIDVYPELIDWDGLCTNTNPDIIPFLELNQDKIDWDLLSANPNIFKRNPRRLKELANFKRCDMKYRS